MQRRGMLIGASAMLGLCLLGCVLVFVAGFPAFRKEIRNGVHDAVATEVAIQIPAAAPGAYTLTADSLQTGLRGHLDDNNNDQAVIVRITTVQIEVGVTSQGQDAIYTGTPVADDGELVMQEMETENGFVGFLLPPDTIAEAIEDAINNHLSANSLRLDAVELADGEITLVVSPL